jgi:O-antigen ligase
MMFSIARGHGCGGMTQLYDRLVIPLLTAILALASSYLVANQKWSELVALFVACSLMALSYRPFFVLSFLFAFLPFQSLLTDMFSAQAGWVAICKDIFVVWALVVVLLRIAAGRPTRRSGGIAPCLMVIASVAAIYVLVGPDLLRAVLALRGVALYPAIALTVMYCLEGPKDLRNLLRVVVFVGALTTIYGILQHYYAFDQTFRSSWSDLSLRQFRFESYGVTSTFPDRPDFGGYLVAVTLLIWQVRLWKTSIPGGLFRALLLAGTLTCLAWTYSRTSWIALLVGVSVVLLLRNRVKAAAGVLVIGVMVAWFYTAHFAQISETTQDATTDYGSVIERKQVWGEAFRLVGMHPLGYGLGTVGGDLVIETPGRDLKPQQNLLLVTDNAYLKLLVQGGFPLCAAFLVLFALVIRLIFILSQAVHDPWLKDVVIWASASFVALLAILCTVDYMEATTSVAIYWLAVGVLAWQISLAHPHRGRQFQLSLRKE